MNILLTIHSLLRWLILLVAVVAIVKLGLGWRRGGPFDGMDRGVVAGYSGLLDLQVLLGLVLLIGDAIFLGEGFPMVRILHAIVMILAVVTAHLPPARPGTEPLSQQQILDEVRRLTASTLGIPLDQVHPDSDLVRDLRID